MPFFNVIPDLFWTRVKFNSNQAIYGRYSIGRKAPSVEQVVQVTSQAQADLLDLEPIHMTQAEIGFKSQYDKLKLYVTPFYNKVSNLASSQFGNNGDNTIYFVPAVYSSQRVIGVELESDFKIAPKFNLLVNLTLQDPKSIVARQWDLKGDGIADDSLIVRNNASIALTQKVLASISPRYIGKKFYSTLNWRYIGKSAANAFDAFTLPAYSQTDFVIGYNITPKIGINANINNVFNKLGVNYWYPPGGFPNNLFSGSYTKEQAETDGNSAVWGAITTPPRSYFFTLTYNF